MNTSALKSSLREKKGRPWQTVCRTAIVAGYVGDKALERQNAFRCDGAETLAHVMRALLEAADVRTGFVGRPPKGGKGRWTRLTLKDIAWRALGSQTDAAIRRTKNALQVAIHLGWVEPTIRVNRYDKERHVVRGAPGVRRVNWEAICACTNTRWLLDSARGHAAEQARIARAKAKAAEQAQEQVKAVLTPAPGRSSETAPSMPSPPPGHPPLPAVTGDPPTGPPSTLLVDTVLRELFKDELAALKATKPGT